MRLRLIQSVFVGIVATVLVAWAIAYTQRGPWPSPFPPTIRTPHAYWSPDSALAGAWPPGGTTSWLYSSEGLAGGYDEILFMSAVADLDALEQRNPERKFVRRDRRSSLMARPPRQDEIVPRGTPFMPIEVLAGWPCLSNSAVIRPPVGSMSGRVEWGLATGSALDTAHPDRDPVLPIRPIWPGFAINALFYSGMYFLLATAAGSMLGLLIRQRRRRRGLCIKFACKYPVSGIDVCPECGTRQHDRSGVGLSATGAEPITSS